MVKKHASPPPGLKKELATIVMKHLILFSYNKDSGHCELANIDFLEDPSDNNPKTFYIDVDEVPTLNMNCRGGKESTLVYQEKVNIIGILILYNLITLFKLQVFIKYVIFSPLLFSFLHPEDC